MKGLLYRGARDIAYGDAPEPMPEERVPDPIDRDSVLAKGLSRHASRKTRLTPCEYCMFRVTRLTGMASKSRALESSNRASIGIR